MSKRHEIECLDRLNEMGTSIDEILQFLIDEKIASREQIKTLKHASDHARQVQQLLASLKKEDKLQLIEYEWQILPVERIRLLLVTDREKKEFSYDEA